MSYFRLLVFIGGDFTKGRFFIAFNDRSEIKGMNNFDSEAGM